MPTSDSILLGLHAVAHRFLWVAVAWHVVLAAALVALQLGWRPRARVAALLALPALSVSAIAAKTGNPFNAAAFLALAVALVIVTATFGRRPIVAGSPIARVAGTGMLALAWIYPRYLQDHSPLIYLIAAPLGTTPCATLAALCGFTLLADGFSSRAWRVLLGGTSLFYGVFGALKLEVELDALLVAGALMVLIPTRHHGTTVAPRGLLPPRVGGGAQLTK